MKYTYAYKTSDGVRHEDSLDAGSRDEVFAVLRGRGIRPIKVVAADGSKENGERGTGEEKWMGCGRCRRPVCGLCALCGLCV